MVRVVVSALAVCLFSYAVYGECRRLAYHACVKSKCQCEEVTGPLQCGNTMYSAWRCSAPTTYFTVEEPVSSSGFDTFQVDEHRCGYQQVFIPSVAATCYWASGSCRCPRVDGNWSQPDQNIPCNGGIVGGIACP